MCVSPVALPAAGLFIGELGGLTSEVECMVQVHEGEMTSEVECTFQESNQVVVRTSEDL